MPTNYSNTRFVTVLDPLPLENVGWEVVVRGQSDFTSVQAIISHYESLTWSVELSGDGGGSVTLDFDHPVFKKPTPSGGSILDEEHLWQLYEDGILRVEFLGTEVVESLLEENGRRVVTISGKGASDTLHWGRVLPPGYGQSGRNDPDIYLPPFWDALGETRQPSPITGTWLYWYSLFQTDGIYWPGPPDYTVTPTSSRWALYWYIFDEVQYRGTCTHITLLFDPLRDTAGVDWTDSAELQMGLGESMRELLERFAAETDSEWVMRPGFQLDVRQHFGSDLSNKVVLHPLTNQKAVRRTRQRGEIGNVVVARDKDGYMSTAVDGDSVTQWRRREVYVEAGTAVDASSRGDVANSALRQLKDEIRSWTISVEPTGFGRRPFVDFFVGDWVSIELTEDEAVTNYHESFRVQAISGSVDTSGYSTVELTLESKANYKARMLAKSVDKIGGQTGFVTAATPISAPASLGGSSIGDLGNVDITNVTNNQTLVYNSVTQVFEAADIQAGVILQASPPTGELQVGQIWVDSDSVGSLGGGEGLDAQWNPLTAPVWADEFRDGVLDPAWTRADNASHVAHVIWTEGADSLSCRHTTNADTSPQMHALLISLTGRGGAFATGDAIVVAGRFLGTYATNYTMWGPCLTDGVVHGTSNLVMAQMYSNTSNAGPGVFRVNGSNGMVSDTGSPGDQMNPTNGPVYMRLVCTGVNTWRGDLSPDGVSWWVGRTLTYTLTPAYMGFAVSNWGTTMQSVTSYDFIRRYSGVT